jgi:hypothetical protein
MIFLMFFCYATSRPRRSPRPSAACCSGSPAGSRWGPRWPGAAGILAVSVALSAVLFRRRTVT